MVTHTLPVLSPCRLIEIGNYLPAGELFRDIQQFKPAIEAFIRAEAWDRARDVARTAAPQYKYGLVHHPRPASCGCCLHQLTVVSGCLTSLLRVVFRDMVEREYTSHLRASNDADGMVQAGVVDGALDLYAQRGEWDKVLEVASKEGGESLNRYSVPFMTQYLERGARTAAYNELSCSPFSIMHSACRSTRARSSYCG